MLTSNFVAGFICCSVVVLLYLIHELVQVLKEWMLILKECLDELRNE